MSDGIPACAKTSKQAMAISLHLILDLLATLFLALTPGSQATLKTRPSPQSQGTLLAKQIATRSSPCMSERSTELPTSPHSDSTGDATRKHDTWHRLSFQDLPPP